MRLRSMLRPGQVDVWYTRTADCLDAGMERHYRSLLTDEEASRLERFRFPYLRQEYLVTRALCRLTLSHYADVAPCDWRFIANRYGRPEIAGPGSGHRLRFNLSNARSLVACAVTLDDDIGVDVEEIDRPGETLSIAHHYFSPKELAGLRALPEARQQDRFYALWTLKEAYIKARGMGLSIPLDRFSFEIGREIGIELAPELGDRAERWHFELRPVGDRHLLAVCAERTDVAPVEVRFHACVPGLDMPGRAVG